MVELAVTVAIFAVVATFAVPNFMKQVIHYRFSGYSEELSVTLQVAHMNALRSGYQYRVLVNLDFGNFSLDKGDAPSGSAAWTTEITHNAPSQGTPVTKVVYQGDTCGDATIAHPVSIIFNPNHTSDGRIICLQSPTGETREIHIQAGTSRVRLTRG